MPARSSGGRTMTSTSKIERRNWWWRRHKTLSGSEEIDFGVFGYPCHIRWNRRFDRRGDGERGFLSVGCDTKRSMFGILFQHYSEGYEFDAHVDGVTTNHAITLVLRKPEAGGEFFVEGPVRRFFRDRIFVFDGGKHPHGVTRIDKGSRAVLMFQRGRW